MKTLLILGSVLLALPFISTAQQKDCCDKAGCCLVKVEKPTISKGYYAIGNNAKKLARQKPMECCEKAESNGNPTVNKGYYAIGKNEEKLQKSNSAQVIKAAVPVQKGYYAIGNNRKKLQTTNKQESECCPCNCK